MGFWSKCPNYPQLLFVGWSPIAESSGSAIAFILAVPIMLGFLLFVCFKLRMLSNTYAEPQLLRQLSTESQERHPRYLCVLEDIVWGNTLQVPSAFFPCRCFTCKESTACSGTAAAGENTWGQAAFTFQESCWVKPCFREFRHTWLQAQNWNVRGLNTFCTSIVWKGKESCAVRPCIHISYLSTLEILFIPWSPVSYLGLTA